MSAVWAPVSILYSIATTTRNKLYDWRILRAAKLDAPVVAIGNVTVGGTGKTPVLITLAEKVLEKYAHVGVVSRGYRRRTKGVLEVEMANDAVKKFGDEPVLIKTKMPKATVFVAERRVLAARKVLEKNEKAIIFADDAIQHRRLSRNLNILLLDAFDEPSQYRLLPWGRGRERLKPALRRSDYVVLTKSNLLGGEKLKERMEWLQKLTDKPILKAPYVLDGFVMGQQWQQTLPDKAYLVSAVARPESVDKILENKLTVVKHKIFEDHHHYTDLEVESILDEASQMGARWVVCTEKDLVKLRLFPRLEGRLWVIKLKVKFEGDVNSLYDDIFKLARARR